jgi:hypothetical protein
MMRAICPTIEPTAPPAPRRRPCRRERLRHVEQPEVRREPGRAEDVQRELRLRSGRQLAAARRRALTA